MPRRVIPLVVKDAFLTFAVSVALKGQILRWSISPRIEPRNTEYV